MNFSEQLKTDLSPRLGRFSALMAEWRKQDETFYHIAEHDYGTYLYESRKLMDDLFRKEKDIYMIYEGIPLDEVNEMEFTGDCDRKVALYFLKPDWVDLPFSEINGYINSCAKFSKEVYWEVVTTGHPLDAIGVVEITY